MSASSGGSRRADSQQLARQWAVLRLLADSGRSFSVREIADQLRCSKSTVQRDLATLEQQFALIEQSAGRQKRTYRIDAAIRALETISFGTMDLLALHAAHTALAALDGAPFGADLRNVVNKIRGFLSPRHNGGLDAMSRVFLPHPRGAIDYSDQRDLIDDVVGAIAKRRVCRVRYHAAWKGTTREHRLRPLRLVWHRSALYLLCSIGGKPRVSTLAVQRIHRLEVTSETFRPPRIDVAGHIKRAFGIFVSDAEEEVEILFDRDIAWRIEERVYHPEERKQRLADGRLCYQLRSSAQWEIVPWVQSFGGLAELVRPKTWRETIRDAAQTMARLHGAPAGA